MDVYRLWRATPLYRARRLEKALDTPAHIYYKYEGTSPAGSHKPNTAVAQAYYNKRAGIRRLATETGAGQWGSALSLACQLFGLECTVYMVRISYDQKPYRRMMMHAWGAEVFPSPSDQTNSGRGVLAATPDSPGSLGIAISEAVEDAATHSDTNYSLGSVLNHVMLHQTVIGQEAKLQMAAGRRRARRGDRLLRRRQQFRRPGAAVRARPPGRQGAAHPGGRAVRLSQPHQGHVRLRLRRHRQADAADQDVHPGPRFRAARHPRRRAALPRRLAAAQPPAATGTHRGQGVSATAGASRRPLQFARTEGILPAPESSHAIRAAIDEALAAREEGRAKVILFCLSGHGHFDLGSYESYLAGKLQDYEYAGRELDAATLAN